MSPSRFLAFCTAFLGILSLPVLANALLFSRTGEFLSLSEVAHIQQTSPVSCLYGTAIHEDTYYQKLEGFRQTHSDTVAIGSSRTMQIRSSFFTTSFYNLGGTVRSPKDIHNIVADILHIHQPKTVFLNLDFWWFHPSYKAYYTDRPPVRARMGIGSLFLPFQWLIEGKMSPREYASLLWNGRSQDCAIGIRALLHRDGTEPDGSNEYTSRITGPYTHDAFAAALKNIQSGEGFYSHGARASDEAVRELISAIHEMEEKGIMVVVFLPPVAPTVFDAMQLQPQDYAFIDDLTRRLTTAGIRFTNAHNPATLGTTDCEFVDEYHGGDLVYAKLLQRIQHDRPEVSTILKSDYLHEVIRRESGHALIKNTELTEKPEQDFLGLGCKK